jgi:hypothetical protein
MKKLLITVATLLAFATSAQAQTEMSEQKKLDIMATVSAALFLYDKECGGLPSPARLALKTLNDSLTAAGPAGTRASTVAFLRRSADLSEAAGKGEKRGWCDLISYSYKRVFEQGL